MGFMSLGAAAGAAALFAGGMGVAAYASTGSYNVSTTNQIVKSDGRYNLDVPDSQRAGHVMAHVDGGLYISGSNHGYFQTQSDSYPWQTVTGFNGPGRRNISADIHPGDVRKASTVRVRVCHTVFGPDRCTSRTLG